MVAGMARANRLRVDGGVFHLTHRRHNGAFLSSALQMKPDQVEVQLEAEALGYL